MRHHPARPHPADGATRTVRRTAALVLSIVLGGVLAGCGGGHGHEAPYRGALEQPAAEITAHAEDTFPAAPPPFSAGVFPCSRCHGPAAPLAADVPVFPHAAHLAKGLECGDCHEDESAPQAADPALCDECHEPGARGSERAEAYFATIGDGIPRRFDADVLDPQHGRHKEAGVVCADCHGEIGDAPVRKPGSAVLMKTCTTCHAERKAPSTCETCHPPGTKPPHENVVLHHAEDQRGCLDCHDARNRDVLHLANGTPVPFAESYRLCGQCHGPHLRDWKLGIHGKRMGSWDGRKEYLLCAHCHDPHNPRFPKMKPLAPPTRPEDVR